MPEETKLCSKHTDALKAAYTADKELRILRTVMRRILQLEGASAKSLERLETLVWLAYIDGARAGAIILAIELERKAVAQTAEQSTQKPN